MTEGFGLCTVFKSLAILKGYGFDLCVIWLLETNNFVVSYLFEGNHFHRRVGLYDLQRPLPTPTIL